MCTNFSPIGVRDLREYKKQRKGRIWNTETERDRETDPISEGLSPLPCHGGQGPEGKPFSHLGRGSRKKKTKGPPLPFSSGGAGTLPWPSSSSPRSTPTPPPSSPTSPSPYPSIYIGPLSRNPLYPLLEHGALCFILLYNDVLPSYDA